MALDSVHYLPLAVFVLLPGTFLVTYIISIWTGHVAVEFPYISDTGTYTPESCIFAQSLNIVSFLVVLTVYVRYKQIEQYYRDHLSQDSSRILSLNWIALWIGCVSAFGLSIVANFQETAVFRVHMTGAMMCFGFGVIYAWLQTAMSFKMIPLEVNSKRIAIFRAILSTIMTFTFLVSSVCGPMALRRFNGENPRKWTPADGGWSLHLASTVSEWISAMTLDVFILTYVREMHHISLSSPRVMFVIENVPMPDQEWVGDASQSLRPAIQGVNRRGNITVNSMNSEVTANESFTSMNNSIIS